MALLDDDYIQQPTDAEGYIVAARGMLDGALPLKDVEPIPVFALTLLCGYATEASLKAMLSQVGVPTAELSGHTLGHKLLRLWERAETEGVSLPSPRPPWVEHSGSRLCCAASPPIPAGVSRDRSTEPARHAEWRQESGRNCNCHGRVALHYFGPMSASTLGGKSDSRIRALQWLGG